MTFARDLWVRVETIHAVTYFAEESATAAIDLGLSGFWMGYFGFRAAPLGCVGAGVVEATFCNFAPTFVQRWVPEVWALATPQALLDARVGAAAATLRRIVPGVDDLAADPAVRTALFDAVRRGSSAGRPLFAANRLLPVSTDDVEMLWQFCTSLREHRGDGHVAALTAAGIDGLEAHVLIAIEQANSPTDLQRTRGWTEHDWADAMARCESRGLIDAEGGLTQSGIAARADVESRTDALASAPFDTLSVSECDALINALDGAARAVSESGVVRYPNPMGLPALD